MNHDELRMAGLDRWNTLLAEAALARRTRQPQAPRAAFRPRLARSLVGLAARIDPAAAQQRRATTSL